METPQGWKDLLEALSLMGSRAEDNYPFVCEHDELYVMADPARFTPEELARLEELSFRPTDDDTFLSHRFGSA